MAWIVIHANSLVSQENSCEGGCRISGALASMKGDEPIWKSDYIS